MRKAPCPTASRPVRPTILNGRDEGRELRSRFYDGRPYAFVIDRLLSRLHGIVTDQVRPDERVLDAGCGTGDLVFRMAPKVKEAVGVELSPAMVDYAERRLAETGFSHVSFVLGDVTQALAHHPNGYFDAATIILVLHEMPPETRAQVLQELSRLAKRVLCVEFSAPQPWNMTGIMNRMAEMAAGPEHFRAFRDFRRCGGTMGIASGAGLSCRRIRYIGDKTMELSDIRQKK